MKSFRHDQRVSNTKYVFIAKPEKKPTTYAIVKAKVNSIYFNNNQYTERLTRVLNPPPSKNLTL